MLWVKCASFEKYASIFVSIGISQCVRKLNFQYSWATDILGVVTSLFLYRLLKHKIMNCMLKTHSSCLQLQPCFPSAPCLSNSTGEHGLFTHYQFIPSVLCMPVPEPKLAFGMELLAEVCYSLQFQNYVLKKKLMPESTLKSWIPKWFPLGLTVVF